MKSLTLIMVAMALVMFVVAKASYAQETCKVAGTIKAVDCDGKKLTCTVKEGDAEKEKTCAVADDAKITLNGNEAKLADLKAGDKVECDCTMAGETMTAKTIAAKRE